MFKTKALVASVFAIAASGQVFAYNCSNVPGYSAGSVAQNGIVEYCPENVIVLHAWRVYDILFGFSAGKFFDQNFTSKMVVKQLSNGRFDSGLTAI